ncbi:MAG: hypothetical protein E6G94_01940 [Alphaproteobacteria bacterium]|nr:MAG: hypothetical protein E6G94_01940 [Alphaproteobacteria bacterium]
MPGAVTDATTELLRALRGQVEGRAEFVLEKVTSRRWASITFTGARHEVRFRIEGDEAGEVAGRFVAGAAAAEFAMRGHLLADLAVVAEERVPGGVRIALEALTVEDA